MTISFTSDDKTFEQVKKQLNRCVEVIKLVDYTDTSIHMKELMYVRVNCCNNKNTEELFRISNVLNLTIVDFDRRTVLLESSQTESQNNNIIEAMMSFYPNRIEVTRGGSVAVEAINL